MSIAAFVATVRARRLASEARGMKMLAAYVNVEGEKVITRHLLETTLADTEFFPHLILSGVRVRVDDRVPHGEMWFLYQGGKK